MRKRNFTRQVGVLITEEIYNQLIEQTNREELSISEWIREAVLIRLSKESKDRINRHLYNLPIKERRTLK